MKKLKIRTWLAVTGSFVVLANWQGLGNSFAAEVEPKAFSPPGEEALISPGGKPFLMEEPYSVAGKEECRRLMTEVVSSVREPGRYEFLVTGVDYEPETLVIAQLFPEVICISNTELSREEENGQDIVTCRIGFERSRPEELCEHRWEREILESPGCLLGGRELVFCGLCGSQDLSILAALGHVDSGGDTVCDRCGCRTENQKEGERIHVRYESSQGTQTLDFICGGETEAGQKYACDGGIPAKVVLRSAESIPGTPGEKLRWWLMTDFFNGISVREACREVWLLDSLGNLAEPESWDGKTDVRPGLLLEHVDSRAVEKRSWSVGDSQLRELGGIFYRFRCVDDDYRDDSSYNQKKALFLCETVIGSDIDSSDTQREILPFGENNNYKNSMVRRWLLENHREESGEIYPILTGVNSAFQGKTEDGAFGEMTEKGLSSWELPFQYATDRLFLLSVEEALLYRDKLWEVSGGGTAFRRGYWLRTPVYETNGAGNFQYGNLEYVVDLEQGCIRPAEVSDGSFGIRPAFCLLQE